MNKFHNKILFNSIDNCFLNLKIFIVIQPGKLNVSKFKITAYKNSVKYMGVSLGNKFNDKIDNECSFFTFKSKYTVISKYIICIV